MRTCPACGFRAPFHRPTCAALVTSPGWWAREVAPREVAPGVCADCGLSSDANSTGCPNHGEGLDAVSRPLPYVVTE